jgi:predicted dithiol-disulfide oxidoreductase (DUF899 family)
MSITFPGESTDYRSARDRLLEEEVKLRRAMEAVAVARRALPPGGLTPDDYVFDGLGPDGAPMKWKLSELFAPGKDSSSSTTSCSRAIQTMTGRGLPKA